MTSECRERVGGSGTYQAVTAKAGGTRDEIRFLIKNGCKESLHILLYRTAFTVNHRLRLEAELNKRESGIA